MKKVAILVLAFCMVFLAACGSTSPSDALKADLEDAKSSPDAIIGEVGTDTFGEQATELLINKVLEFQYELGEETVDGDTATVETTITTYPFGEIFNDVVNDFIDEAYANPSIASDEAALTALLDELMTKALNDADMTYVATISIELKKDGNSWVVQESDDLSNALTGGMLDFANGVLG